MNNTQRVFLKNISSDDFRLLANINQLNKIIANNALTNLKIFFKFERKVLPFNINLRMVHQSKACENIYSVIVKETVKAVTRQYRTYTNLRVKTMDYRYHPITEPPLLTDIDLFPLIIPFSFIKPDAKGVFKFPTSFAFKAYNPKFDVGIQIPPTIYHQNIKQIWLHIIGQKVVIDFVLPPKPLKKKQHFTLDPTIHAQVQFDPVKNLVHLRIRDNEFTYCFSQLAEANDIWNQDMLRLKQIALQQYQEIPTQRMETMVLQKENKIVDFATKAGRWTIDLCLKHKAGSVEFINDKIFDLAETGNTLYAPVPSWMLRDRIKRLCKQYSIDYKETDIY